MEPCSSLQFQISLLHSLLLPGTGSIEQFLVLHTTQSSFALLHSAPSVLVPYPHSLSPVPRPSLLVESCSLFPQPGCLFWTSVALTKLTPLHRCLWVQVCLHPFSVLTVFGTVIVRYITFLEAIPSTQFIVKAYCILNEYMRPIKYQNLWVFFFHLNESSLGVKEKINLDYVLLYKGISLNQPCYLLLLQL